jgi:hypothetical protein
MLDIGTEPLEPLRLSFKFKIAIANLKGINCQVLTKFW